MYYESFTEPALEIEKKNVRISGIDAGRFIAVAAVVLIHTAHDISYTILPHLPQQPHEGEFGINAGDVITQLARFAVPFFSLASGFFSRSALRTRSLRRSKCLHGAYFCRFCCFRPSITSSVPLDLSGSRNRLTWLAGS